VKKGFQKRNQGVREYVEERRQGVRPGDLRRKKEGKGYSKGKSDMIGSH